MKTLSTVDALNVVLIYGIGAQPITEPVACRGRRYLREPL
jgi:hypothetical protein